MSIKVTIEHDEGLFRREFRISRVADAADTVQSHYDARHTYLIEGVGGRYRPTATFTHRYGDPLQTLFIEGLAALQDDPHADRSIYEARPGRSSTVASEPIRTTSTGGES